MHHLSLLSTSPIEAAGIPGNEYANVARQSTSRHHVTIREILPIIAAIAIIGIADLGPNIFTNIGRRIKEDLVPTIPLNAPVNMATIVMQI